MPTREQLLEQIRKLRNLAADVAGTPEGAAATRKIRELMKRYGISATDVSPRPPRVATKKPSPVTKPSSTSPTPATITLKIGTVRIRWKL